MRLVDADALSEKLCKTTIFVKDGEVFQRMINDAPTVSAEAEQVTGKLKKPCNSLLKADSDDCKESESKLDLISRQDALCILKKKMIDRPLDSDRWVIRDIAVEIKLLPSAEPKTGKWIQDDDYICDQCGHHMIVGGGAYNFCPNCGADMRGENHE